jgi:hypothetical protein
MGKNPVYLNKKESEALIIVFDNLLEDRGMMIPDADTFDAVARILIKHRGYAIIEGDKITSPDKIWKRE